MSFLPTRPTGTGHALANQGELEPGPPSVLLVTGDPALREEVQVVAAAAGVCVRADPATSPDPFWWARARLVLLGPDADRARLPGDRPGLVRIGHGPPVRAGDAEENLDLDLGTGRLETLLRQAREPLDPAGCTVGVLGAVGGSGASTLAVALALAARTCLLVDGDPLGPGAQTALGWEDLGGVRWPELDTVDGHLRAGTLGAVLPGRGGVSLLSYDRGSPAVPPRCRASGLLDVLTVGRLEFGCVIVDLPRRCEAPDLLVWRQLDAAVVVTTGTVAGALAASRLVGTLRGLVGRVAVVVRHRPGGLGHEQVRELFEVDTVTGWPHERHLPAAADAGDLAAAVTRGRTSRLATDLLAWARR